MPSRWLNNNRISVSHWLLELSCIFYSLSELIEEHKERLRKQLEDFETFEQRRTEFRATRQSDRGGAGAKGDRSRNEKPSGPGRRGESRYDDDNAEEEEESSEESEEEDGEILDHAAPAAAAAPGSDPSDQKAEENFETPAAAFDSEPAADPPMESENNGLAEVEAKKKTRF